MRTHDILLREKIKEALKSFGNDSLRFATINLFEVLGYRTSRKINLREPTFQEFEKRFSFNGRAGFDFEKAKIDDWESVDLAFQITHVELSGQLQLFDENRLFDHSSYSSYLFVILDLKENSYSRREISQITREVNKQFSMPVMVVARYGKHISLSIINRRKHKRQEDRNVLEKVTLIMDISFEGEKRSHLEILVDLSLSQISRKRDIRGFDDLQKAWEEVLDTRELNKRFYNDLYQWYNWAKDFVQFPAQNAEKPHYPNEDPSYALIRLITRIIFVWFLREKNLLSDDLFEERKLKEILNDFRSSTESSNYYNAILQNLFFGALNQDQNQREFIAIDDPKASPGFRFLEFFKIGRDEVLDMFRHVPFLNGGLFECLDDYGQADKHYALLDGFSEKPGQRAVIPDRLLFDEGYSSRRNPRNVRASYFGDEGGGLFKIFSRYKFTVTENTPIEEEVALDPELLGQVFENLLAALVGESKETARKEAGTYYTPKVIVDRMVDDSLARFLSRKFFENGYHNREAQLGKLLQYSEDDTDFLEGEIGLILDSISQCRIIDPSCGSGAFSIGVLNKLIHILSRVDPQNQRFRATAGYTERYAKVSNENYKRKLILIERCIFGIDKEPIAVLIAKLRVFITLLIDQDVNQNAEQNFGIIPLPNLEMNFVVANTLFDFPINVSAFGDSLLHERRLKYFYEIDHTEKSRLQKAIHSDQLELIRKGSEIHSALHTGSFDLFDPSFSASWFQPEVMFGLSLDKGFDIVIGNPPWGAKLAAEEKKALKSKFPEIDSKSSNTLAYFIGWAMENYSSVISFVISDNLLTKDFPETRKKILPYVSRISWLGNSGHTGSSKPFPHITHDVCILTIEKHISSSILFSKEEKFDPNNTQIPIVEISKETAVQKEFGYVFNLMADSVDFQILQRIERFQKLETFVECHEGIHSGSVRDEIFFPEKLHDECYPLFLGAGSGDEINNYFSEPNKWFVDLSEKGLNTLRKGRGGIGGETQFNLPKIVLTRTGDPVKGFTDIGNYISNNFFALQHREKAKNDMEFLNYILPFVISPIAQYFYRTFASPRLGSRFVETKIKHILLFRAPEDCAHRKAVSTIVALVQKLRHNVKDSLTFERILNALVYEVYFGQELEEAGIEILEPMRKFLDFDNRAEDLSLQVLMEMQKSLNSPSNEVMIAIAKLDSIPMIRKIEKRRYQ